MQLSAQSQLVLSHILFDCQLILRYLKCEKRAMLSSAQSHALKVEGVGQTVYKGM